MYTIEKLLDIILNKSEQLEEDLKEDSDLKNLTAKQLHCIELIKRLENPTLSELSEKMQITKPSTSVMLDRLEANGYLVKVKSDSDRRSAHVHLTKKGERAARLHSEVHEKFACRLTEELTESEKEILIVLLNKAIKSIE